MKKKYFQMWIASIVMVVLAIISFLLFLLDVHSIPRLIITLIFVAGAVALFIFSNKKLMLDGGYTAVDAIFFYSTCKRNNINGVKDLMSDSQISRKTVEKFDFAKDLSEKELKILFNDGQKYSEIFHKK